MPMPTPHADEKRDDFVARCMKDPATQDITGANADETQARRVAACERTFDDAKKAADVDAEVYGLKAAGPITIVDGDQGRVQADFCTFDDVDNDGEVTLSGAIDDGMKCTVSSYNHDTVMGQMLGTGIPDQPPVGKGIIRVVGNKAIADLQYFMETQRGREAFLTVKAMGPDARWSYAFRKTQVAKPTPEWEAKGARKLLVKLGPLLDGAMEVSPVKMPAGKGTATLSTKAAQPTASVDGVEHPAEDFAYVPDPQKPSTWKLPIFDKIHAEEAVDRFDQAEIPESERAAVRARVLEAARKFGIDVSPKDEIKKSVERSAIDAQLETRIPRVKRLIGLE